MSIAHTDKTIVKPDIEIEQETWDGGILFKHPRFCTSNCERGYKEDRRQGVIYASVEMHFDSGNVRIVGHHDAARWTRRCAYCGDGKK